MSINDYKNDRQSALQYARDCLLGDPDAWRAAVEEKGVDEAAAELVAFAKGEAHKIGETIGRVPAEEEERFASLVAEELASLVSCHAASRDWLCVSAE